MENQQRIKFSLSILLNVNGETGIAHFAEALTRFANDIGDASLNIEKLDTSPQLADYLLEQIENDDIASSTRANRITTVNWIRQEFPDIKLADLPKDFILQLIKRLQENQLSNNTIIKHLRHLKIYIYRAVKEGLLSQEWRDDEKFRIRSEPYKHHLLTSEDVEKIENVIIPRGERPKWKIVREAFLFCCYTGLRYSDVSQITTDNFIVRNGCTWLIFVTKKTQTKVSIPVSLLFKGKAMHIYNKVKRRKGIIFPIMDNSTANKVLIRIGHYAGINKHFSFHSARHTFATQLLYEGVSLEVVQKLLGHHSIRTTQIYAEITSQTILKELTKKRRR